jgi:hypothetical protein
MRRLWSPFTRNLLIIAAAAIVIVVLSLEETLDVVGGLLSIAFFLAVAFFLFLLWRERRGDIEAWSDWNRRLFYGAVILAVVDIGAVIGLGPRGLDLLVFFVVLAVCALTIWRVWRAEHRYV